MDESIYTFNTVALGFLLPTHSKHTKISKGSLPASVYRQPFKSPLAFSWSKAFGSSTLPGGGQERAGSHTRQPGDTAANPLSLETDACYYCALPCSGIYCCVPLPWKVEPTGTKERLDFGRVCPLPWRGQDRTPFTQSLCGKNSGELPSVGGVSVGRKSLLPWPPLLLLIPLNSARPSPPQVHFSKGNRSFLWLSLGRGRRKAGEEKSPPGGHSLATTHK